MSQCTVKRKIRHSPPLDLCWFVKFKVLQDSESGKNENKEIEKYIYQYTLFTLATLSNSIRYCASPDTFRFEPGDSVHPFLSQTVTFLLN